MCTPIMPTKSRLYKGSEIRALKPADKPYVCRFGHGLYLWVTPNGTKSWQVRYRGLNDKTAGTMIGRWPTMTFDDAKAKREEMRLAKRAGTDPVITAKTQRLERREAQAATFRVMAEGWIEEMAPKWSANYRRVIPGRLRLHAFPEIGDVPVAELTQDHVRAAVKSVATASMKVIIKGHISSVLDYAVANGRAPHNVARLIARYLPTRDFTKDKPRVHVETIEAARKVLELVERTDTLPSRSMPLLLAHRFLALTGVRKMEALGARWDEFDAALTTWSIPAARMKGGKRGHIVPLAPQAAEVIRAARAWQAVNGQRSDHVFASRERGVGCVNGQSLNKVMSLALARGGLAGAHVPHGWRATFATLTNESDHTIALLVEKALAHKTRSEVASRYDHSAHIEPRRLIACAWADMLLADAPSAWSLIGLPAPRAKVVQLDARRAA
jgi:integrase